MLAGTKAYPTMKVTTLITALGLGLICFGAEQPSLDSHLEPLRPLLEKTWKDSGAAAVDLGNEEANLTRVNEALWVIEDDIRDEERASRFGPRFIELARAVYVTNDERAAIKKRINTLLGSSIVEEKSYKSYKPE